jgi:hypothetical protein
MPIFEMPSQQTGVSSLDWVKENTNASSNNQDWKVQVCDNEVAYLTK